MRREEWQVIGKDFGWERRAGGKKSELCLLLSLWYALEARPMQVCIQTGDFARTFAAVFPGVYVRTAQAWLHFRSLGYIKESWLHFSAEESTCPHVATFQTIALQI
jgi:hypothetical protein